MSTAQPSLAEQTPPEDVAKGTVMEPPTLEAAACLIAVTDELSGTLNTGVAAVFARQKEIEAAARELQAQAALFATNTARWASMAADFDTALKARASAGKVYFELTILRAGCWGLRRLDRQTGTGPGEVGDVVGRASSSQK